MDGSSQPPSKMIAAWPLPSASPHQPSPMSLARHAEPVLEEVEVLWMPAMDSGESITAAVLSVVGDAAAALAR